MTGLLGIKHKAWVWTRITIELSVGLNFFPEKALPQTKQTFQDTDKAVEVGYIFHLYKKLKANNDILL